MEQTYEVHGKDFLFACEDWGNNTDEEQANAVDILFNSMADMGASNIESLHAQLTRKEPSETLDDLADTAVKEATKGWASQPQSGHSLTVVAE